MADELAALRTKLAQAEAEIVMLTNRDETPGLRYFEFWSETMDCDVAAGATITADESDEGAFWAVEIHEVWIGIHNLTSHLREETLAAVTAEAHAHIGPELYTTEALRRAAIQACKLRR